MGEYADAILNGEFCELCGEYLGDDLGYTQRCPECHDEFTKMELEDEMK